MDEGLVGEEQFEEARARQDGHHDADNDDDDHDDRDGNGAEGDEVIFVWDRLAEGDGAGVDDILASNHPADDGVDDRQQLRRRRSDGQLMNGGHVSFSLFLLGHLPGIFSFVPFFLVFF